MGQTPRNTVELRNFPTALGKRQDEHIEELQREIQLIALSLAPPAPGDAAVVHQMPPALSALVEQLFEHYATELDEPTRRRQEAFDRGEESVTITYPVLPATRGVTLAWRAMMEQVDAFCRDGELLALETPPDLVALREWVLQEFLSQLDGNPPRPWTGPLR